jgi:hypothetical protein
MSFNALIPQANNRLSQSQIDILGNFTALGAIAGNANPNSNLLNGAAGFNFVYLPLQGAQPNFIATSSNIWTQLNNIPALGNTGRNELFIRTDSANTAANQGIPITTATKATKGYTFLPSGIILQWGTTLLLAATGNLDNAANGGFALTFPTACLNVQLSFSGSSDQNTFAYIRGMTTTNFNLYVVPRDGTSAINAAIAYYFAIGY